MKKTTLLNSTRCVVNQHINDNFESTIQNQNEEIKEDSAAQNPQANFGFPLIDIDKAFAN